MKIGIFCVNYNSYNYLYDYLDSINMAAKEVEGECAVTVAVADNTEENYQEIKTAYPDIEVRAFPYHKNYGYMGGAVQVMKELGEAYSKAFDFLIVSNVDIKVDKAFFTDLLAYDYKGVGWIVPSVYRTRNNNSNENPFQTAKPSKSKMDSLISLYKHPLIYGLYETYCRFKNSKQAQVKLTVDESPQQIYAGMGSIFVFTKSLIEKEYPLEFPCFMYGEELYYGYLVERNGLKTMFYPKIKVYDIGNVSTGKLGNSRKCKMNYESLKKLKSIIYSK